KGRCGAIGLRAMPGLEASLAEWTGYPLDTLYQALTELVQHGWIERERSIIWVVRGLSFEPTLTPSNRFHRAFVSREFGSLPNLPICQRFRAFNAAWFP